MGKIKNKYVHLEWIHSNNEYPNHIYSEIGEDNYEIRKFEIYKNGKVGFAVGILEVNNCGLSEEPFPPLEELIGMDEWGEEIKACEITKSEFDSIWGEKILPLILP